MKKRTLCVYDDVKRNCEVILDYFRNTSSQACVGGVTWGVEYQRDMP